MISFFEGIVEFIVTAIGLVIQTFKSILWVIGSIPQFTVTITSLFAYCPAELLLFLEVSLAITILFAILRMIK